MSSIQINGNEIYYISSDEIDSSKPTLFMLHGAWAESSNMGISNRILNKSGWL